MSESTMAVVVFYLTGLAAWAITAGIEWSVYGGTRRARLALMAPVWPLGLLVMAGQAIGRLGLALGALVIEAARVDDGKDS